MDELGSSFLTIMTKGVKSNTYKFALARALLEYSESKYSITDISQLLEDDQSIRIDYSYLAEKFLEYYWHQVWKYKIRQNFDSNKLPYAITIIQEEFNERDAQGTFDDLPEDKKQRAIERIHKMVFLKHPQVVPRFQKFRVGSKTEEQKIFYEHDETCIKLNPEALAYFHKYHRHLDKAVTLEWAKFLEKTNNMPRLIAKVENQPPKRGSLVNVRNVLEPIFPKCFYCETRLQDRKIEVDHFIPWSYIYDDEAWNLVLACRSCNNKKRDSLAEKSYLKDLISRNHQYGGEIEPLGKSLDLIGRHKSPSCKTEGWECAITDQYHDCLGYGFQPIPLP